jgi:hypothetical protein
MIRAMTKYAFPHVLVSSAFGTTLISIVAAWLVTFPLEGATPDTVKIEHAKPSNNNPSSHRLYRLSPIPAGADWTS